MTARGEKCLCYRLLKRCDYGRICMEGLYEGDSYVSQV